MTLIKCPYCGKENEDTLEYCESCDKRIVPYKRVEKGKESGNDKKKTVLKLWTEKIKYYNGFVCAICAFLAFFIKQIRPISAIAAIESIVLCTIYLTTNNKKIVLPIIGIVLDAFCLWLYICYYV